MKMSEPEDNTEHRTSEIFEPVVSLPVATISNAEENETCVFKQRAKLFRFDRAEDPPEWKERGTGIIKILKHNETGHYRILMRREQTLKICANHFISSCSELRSNCGNGKAFVWQTLADFADEVPKPESLGIRFPREEEAKQFKKLFDEGRCHISCEPQGETSDGLKNKDDQSKPKDCDESKLTEALKSLQVDPVTGSGDQEKPTIVAAN